MTDSFRSAPVDLGHGVVVEFRYGDGRMDAVWSPRMPHGRRARQIMPAYLRASSLSCAIAGMSVKDPIKEPLFSPHSSLEHIPL